MKTLLLPFLLSFAFLVQAQTPDTAAVRVEIDSLIQLNRSLIKERKFDEAHQVIQQAEEKCRATFGIESAKYGLVMYHTGRTFDYQRDYENAEPNYFKAKEIQENTIGKNHLDYAKTLSDLGWVYYATGNYEKAEPLFLEAIAIREKVSGKEHPDYASSLNYLGNLYLKLGQYEKAETLYLEALAIKEKVLGKEHPDYALSLHNLGLLYLKMGQYEKAEIFYLEAIMIRKKVLGKEHPKYAVSLSGLGGLYRKMGKYEKAELIWLEAKVLREKALGKEHPDYAASLGVLGVLYSDMGQNEKAEIFYLEAKAIREKVLGKEHPEYAKSLNNLGVLYNEMGQYEKAETLHLEAIAIKEKVLGKEHPDYAISLNNLGNLYLKMGQYEKAEPFHMEAKMIREKVLGKEHPKYAVSLSNLGILYWNMGNYEKAEPLYLETIAIREKVLGNEHPDYAASLANLGILYWAIGQYEKAEAFYLEANETRKLLLLKAARHLSERELLSYTTTFISNQNRLLSFANRQDVVAGSVYDNSLFYKGFLLNATQKVKRLAQTDLMSNELFLRLKGYNRRLAKAYSNPIAERDSSTIADLEKKTNNVEKELARSVAGFGEAIRQVNWQEVQAALEPGDAAIEFVNYQFYNPELTDSIMYAALLIRPGDQQPQFISLFEENSLDALLALHQERRSDYVNDLFSLNDRGLSVDDNTSKSLYELIWQPLEKELEGIQTVYFSPSGLLHRINLNAIPLTEEKTVANHFKLVQLQSTRSLVISNGDKNWNDQAFLYGGIQYESDSMAIVLANENLLEEGLASRGALNFDATDTSFRGGKWNYLKWTQKEVEAIDPVLEAGGFRTEMLSGYAATEESFRALGQKGVSPRILHLATHGFFFPDPENQITKNDEEPVFKTSDHPMIRSGLIMAGGNHVWQGNPSLGNLEDGILTAYEISQMDLSNTELVVLSACETGLGDIEGTEGVYGLQRAFKIAGAKYLIMSLWQVPDRETKEFMVTFYRHWLSAGQEDKMTIPDAFRKTQQEMKERFYNPYQWAGFILVE